MIPPNNPWKKLSEKNIYENPWVRLDEHDVINPGGGKSNYGLIHFKNKAIGIIPLEENGDTYLVGQYRYPLNEYSWEIPMGGGPLEDDILDSAKRELKEETGLTAENWRKIARIHTSNSVTDEEGFVFLATGLSQGKNDLDESEADLQIKRLPLKEAVEMAMDNRITDSISVAGLLKAGRIFNL